MAVYAAFATLLTTVRRIGQPSVGNPGRTTAKPAKCPHNTLGAICLDNLAHPRHNTPDNR